MKIIIENIELKPITIECAKIEVSEKLFSFSYDANKFEEFAPQIYLLIARTCESETSHFKITYQNIEFKVKLTSIDLGELIYTSDPYVEIKINCKIIN